MGTDDTWGVAVGDGLRLADEARGNEGSAAGLSPWGVDGGCGMTKRILQLLGAVLIFWFLWTAGTALEKLVLLRGGAVEALR